MSDSEGCALSASCAARAAREAQWRLRQLRRGMPAVPRACLAAQSQLAGRRTWTDSRSHLPDNVFVSTCKTGLLQMLRRLTAHACHLHTASLLSSCSCCPSPNPNPRPTAAAGAVLHAGGARRVPGPSTRRGCGVQPGGRARAAVPHAGRRRPGAARRVQPAARAAPESAGGRAWAAGDAQAAQRPGALRPRPAARGGSSARAAEAPERLGDAGMVQGGVCRKSTGCRTGAGGVEHQCLSQLSIPAAEIMLPAVCWQRGPPRAPGHDLAHAQTVSLSISGSKLSLHCSSNRQTGAIVDAAAPLRRLAACCCCWPISGRPARRARTSRWRPPRTAP